MTYPTYPVFFYHFTSTLYYTIGLVHGELDWLQLLNFTIPLYTTTKHSLTLFYHFSTFFYQSSIILIFLSSTVSNLWHLQSCLHCDLLHNFFNSCLQILGSSVLLPAFNIVPSSSEVHFLTSAPSFITTSMLSILQFTFLIFYLTHLHCLLVLRLKHDVGVRQQLYQPFHLRHQVLRIPERNQTYDSSFHGKAEPDSAATKHTQHSSDVKPDSRSGPRQRCHLRSNGRWTFLFPRLHISFIYVIYYC